MRLAIHTLLRPALVISLLLAGGTGAGMAAEAFPAKSIRLLVPYPPGGSPDLIARNIAPTVAERLGQSVVVENRTGANGMIATDAVAQANPDGYTLLLATDGPIVITPLLRGEAPGSRKMRLAPVTLVADSSFVLLAGPSVSATTLPSIVALARERTAPLSFGSSGVGSQHHLAGVLLSVVAQVKLLHVPYKGFGDAVTDVTAGRVDLLFGSIPAAAPHVAAARLKGIAITGTARSPLLPGVPTAAEQGMPNLAVSAWFGVMAPGDVPAEVLRQLDDAFRFAAQSEGLRASLSKLGLNVIGADRTAFAARIRQETLQWAEIIRVSGAKAE